LVFFDDILIYSRTWDEHLAHLEEVLSIMQAHSLYSNESKCEFGMREILSLIQVDIGGYPPFPTVSKQLYGNFGNLLFLASFNFQGHFEGLNEGISRSRFPMISEGIIEPPK
jgi:hypothetical protein